MAPAKKRRRTKEPAVEQTPSVEETETNGAFPKPQCPIKPPTVEEQAAWPGFCEIESEPAFFNTMLRDFGVKGVMVQEVFGLDDELLASLPRPVYGLIFLYRYKTDAINKQEATCPDNVWFANQLSDFSCATVSLLNIINNVPNIELGEHLQAFKEFTRDLTPYLRGEAIANFPFVRSIHNSFARTMDMLNVDLGLDNAYSDRRKSTTTPKASKTKTSGKNGVVSDEDWVDNESAFHFSAYMPIDGDIWKLDGLDRQPQRLVSISEAGGSDWMSVAAPIIAQKMSEYAVDEIEFGLLSLVHDPLDCQKRDLASSIRLLRDIRDKLQAVEPDWTTRVIDASGILLQPDPMVGLSEENIEAASIDQAATDGLGADALVDLHDDTVRRIKSLRAAAMEHVYSQAEDARRARDRRFDYGPLIWTWLAMLAQRGPDVVKELVEAAGCAR